MAKGLLTILLIVTIGFGLLYVSGCQMDGPGKAPVRRIAVEDYTDKMKAGWIGQMAGVGWGGRRNSATEARLSRKTRCRSGNRI